MYMFSCQISFYIISSLASQNTMMGRMWIKSTNPTRSPCDSLCSHPKWAITDAERTAASLMWVRVSVLTCHSINLHTSVTSNPIQNCTWVTWMYFLDHISICTLQPENQLELLLQLQLLFMTTKTALVSTDVSKRNLFQQCHCIKGVDFNLKMDLSTRYSCCPDLWLFYQ